MSHDEQILITLLAEKNKFFDGTIWSRRVTRWYHKYGCPGTKFTRKLWGGQTFIVCVRWRHHVHSTVVRPYCKLAKWGENCGNVIFWEPSSKCPCLHPWWWSNWPCI